MEGTSGNDPTLVTTVMEDDDAASGTAAEQSFTAQAEQAARDAAAKRRQKILEKANERMSLVEGTFSKQPAAESTVADETAEPTSEAVASSSSSSKLAALRRRRFKKSSAATTEETVPTEATVETVPEAVPEAVPTVEKPAAPPISVVPEAVTASVAEPPVPVELPKKKEEEEKVNEDHDPPKKKYLGVAKMRRRMIKERPPEASSAAAAEERSEAPSAAAAALPRKKRSLITTLPIAMYLVTTLLLFLAGLNIGLQQSAVEYCYSTEGNAAASHRNDDPGVCLWSTVVPSELAPRTSGGLQRLLALMDLTNGGGGAGPKDVPPSGSSPKWQQALRQAIPKWPWMEPAAKATKKMVKPSMATPKWQETLRQEVEEDEFADTGASSTPSSLDPVFGVDLDQLTAGDGLYFVLARFAVRVHRWNLALFYYGPRSLVVDITSFVWSLFQFPPMVFLLAIAIRQGIGKVVLGAKLLEKIVDETQHKDILSTIKTFVTNMLSSSFPTAVTFYDVYTHLRSDMYVVLCGLFVGWAWSHNHQAGSPFGVPPPLDDTGREEL